jgi:hypothetical protein
LRRSVASRGPHAKYPDLVAVKAMRLYFVEDESAAVLANIPKSGAYLKAFETRSRTRRLGSL